MNARMRRLRGPIAALVIVAAATGEVAAGPLTAHRLAIQGVARDANEQLVPAGDVAVRVFADASGGSPLYDSGSEMNGAIAAGIFSVIAGAGTAMMLDADVSYWLELSVAGAEVIGDAAAGRWPFFPNGGSAARPDFEARLDALETAMGFSARVSAREASAGPAGPRTAAGFANVYGLLGLGAVSGATPGGAPFAGHLITQPVGVFTGGGITAELGPYYLFTPSPNPVVRFVRDVPNDQGRSVRVRWRRDQRERPYVADDLQPRITSYTVYRRVEAGQAIAGAVRARDGATLSARAPATLAARSAPDELLGLPAGEWDVLGSFPATLDSTYQTVVATLCDSNDVGLCATDFLVRSITDQPGIYHNAIVASGWSVDNLAPNVPAPLAVQAVAGGHQLSWASSSAPDFRYFRVYRSSDPDFTPGSSSLVQSTTATQWLDSAPGSFTWKVTAVDFNGNESPPASASSTVGVGAGELPTSLAFAAMRPNPFRQSVTLTVDVPQGAGEIELAIFDVAGRRVRTLAAGRLPAGRASFLWDGRGADGDRAVPGIYVARLIGNGRTLTRRATLLP